MRTTTVELTEENLSVAHHDSEFQNTVLDTMANEQEKEGQSWERGRRGQRGRSGGRGNTSKCIVVQLNYNFKLLCPKGMVYKNEKSTHGMGNTFSSRMPDKELVSRPWQR